MKWFFWGEGPGVSKMSPGSRATAGLHRSNLGVALEQEIEIFFETPGPSPKRPLAPSPIDLGEFRNLGTVYQGLRVPRI